MTAQQTHNKPSCAVCDISGSHSGTDDYSCLLGYYAVLLGDWLPTFRGSYCLYLQDSNSQGEFLHLADEGIKIVPYTRQIWPPFLSTLVGLKAVTGSTTSDVRSIVPRKFKVTNHTSTLLLLKSQRVNEKALSESIIGIVKQLESNQNGTTVSPHSEAIT